MNQALGASASDLHGLSPLEQIHLNQLARGHGDKKEAGRGREKKGRVSE